MTVPVFRPSSRIRSAGRSHRYRHLVASASTIDDCRALLRAAPPQLTLLPFGAGQSLGDSCLNDGGALIMTRAMNRVLRLDRAAGVAIVEPGVTVGELADLGLAAPDDEPRWFPAVFPGNAGVTIAGAIANDVHGKNHASHGSFCHHVQALTLLRSDDGTLECSERRNVELFRATLGGLGLTGIIVSATLGLKRVSQPLLECEEIRCDALADAYPLFDASERDWEYRFFWFDPFDPAARGVFTRARHCREPQAAVPQSWPMRAIARLPLPAVIGGPHLWRAWYRLLLARMPRRRSRHMTYRDSLAPLAEFPRWNRLLGARGLLHLQCVVAHEHAAAVLDGILADCRNAGELPCLASIKAFGSRPPAGLLSFPRTGVTAALDFGNAGESTRALLRRIEGRVLDAGGAIYPAKDSTLSPQGFHRSFPAWGEFARHVDPRFSSSFWRRVAESRRCPGTFQGNPHPVSAR